MVGRSTRHTWAVVALVACAACGLFPDLEGLSGGDAAIDVQSGDVTVDATTDAIADAPMDVVEAGDGACPSGRGPTMVKLDGKTCIDTTEVTVAQYRAFFDSVDAGSVTQIAECSWNTSFLPSGGVPGPTKDTNPIAQINWCQAQAFCAWAGKSLCGAFDGGPYPFASFAQATQSVWMSACSANGTKNYPYGATFEAGACNIATIDASANVAPVTSFTACTGSLPGMFDMVGNIKEWDNACSPSGDAAADQCRRRGAGFDDPGNPANKTCAWDETDTRDHQSFTSGVRCCAYLP